MLDFIRGNKASSITIAVTVCVSAFLLSLLTCVLFNFWADAIAQAAAESPDRQIIIGEQQSATALLYVFVLLLACIAIVLVIRNAFTASMQSRMHQLGLLATVGATPRQIRSLLLRETILLSIVPALIGIVLGIIASNAFVGSAIQLSQQIEIEAATSLRFYYHPLLFIATFSLVVITVLVSADLPARKLSKIMPLAAIAGMPETPVRKKARFSVVSRVFGIEGELAQGSMRQRKVALRSASIAIGLSFLVFGVFLSFMTVSQLSVDRTFYERYGVDWDLALELQDISQARAEQIGYELEKNVDSVAVDESDNGMRIYLKVNDNTLSPLQEQVEAVLSTFGCTDYSVIDMAVEKERSEAIWNAYMIVVGGFCGILALIGIAGVITQALGFIYQRKREFARLRSIGMTPRGVIKMLGIEGVFTVGKPLCIALPILVVAAYCLVLLGKQSIPEFCATFPFAVLLAYVGLTLCLVLFANILGGFRILHCDLATTLKDDSLV